MIKVSCNITQFKFNFTCFNSSIPKPVSVNAGNMFIMLAVRSIAEILYMFIRQLPRLYPFKLSTEHCADICIVVEFIGMKVPSFLRCTLSTKIGCKESLIKSAPFAKQNFEISLHTNCLQKLSPNCFVKKIDKSAFLLHFCQGKRQHGSVIEANLPILVALSEFLK